METIFVSDVLLEKYTPKILYNDHDILLYIHGGAFMIGSAATDRLITSSLAKELGIVTYTIDYRLAPRHPFPAAVIDCFAVYKELVKDKNVILVGGSAGGTLALTTIIKAIDEGIKKPLCAVLYSPLTTFEELPSRNKNSLKDSMLDAEILEITKQYYCHNEDIKNQLISPLNANFRLFPPLMVVVDKDEVLYDDSRLLKNKAVQEGIYLNYFEWKGCFHAFPGYYKCSPESDMMFEETVDFISKFLTPTKSDFF